MIVVVLMNGGTPHHAGLIPSMLDETDPRKAAVQFDANYQHGGGWRPMVGFKVKDNGSLKYPGDPVMPPLAAMRLRDELIMIYQAGFVGIFQKDGSFEVARMD